MIKKILSTTIAILICLTPTISFADSNITTAATNNTYQLNDYNKNLNCSNIVKQNYSNGLLEPEKHVDNNLKEYDPISGDLTKTILNKLQKSTNSKPNLNFSKSINAIDANTNKPIANLKYIIMNPDSLKNNQITTNTQIAWLWSYNGQNYTYDPNGYKITNVSIDGVPSIKDSVIGTLNGGIGFATQFKTPGQYIMKFKCMNDHNVWSDEWNITIPVEPTDNNTRPQCVINYSSQIGDTDTEFKFSWINSSDPDSNDSIKNLESNLTKDGQNYPISDCLLSQDSTKYIAKFKEPGNYKLMFRVSDSHNAWSNWAILNITIKAAVPKTPTPGNISFVDAWSKIKANPNNNSTQEAFQRSIPIDSSYLTTTFDKSGNAHNFYLMKFKDEYRDTSTNYMTQDDTFLIYDDNYLTHTPYQNGYYGTWFPEGEMNLQNGIMSANLGYKKYSTSESDFNEYKRLYIFDFYTGKDYTVEYYNGMLNFIRPYFLCLNMTNDDRIVYGQSHFFNDGSGDSFLSRIDRKTGQTITNSNIVFGNNSEVANGGMIDSSNYQFFSSRDGGYLWTINADTLAIVSKVPGTMQNGVFVPTK